MSLIFYNYHLNKYPLIQKEDKIKLIYQAILGPNHLASSLTNEQVLNYLKLEITNTSNIFDENLYEYIGPNYVRVNLHKYSSLNLNLNELVFFFIESTKLANNFELFKTVLSDYFNPEELKDYDYLPISHSSIYKNNYMPSYRVISSSFLNLDLKYLQIKNFLANLQPKTFVALEGRCASGKTTISKQLSKEYTIIEMDDFFLPIEQRTKERLNEIGGNINYELVNKTLVNLKEALNNKEKQFSYLAYDCSNNSYYNKTINLYDIIILEGVYSTHPFFRKHIDKIIYLYVDKTTQFQRINERKLKDMFISKWIPLEESYFNSFDIISLCDLIV